MTVAGASFTGLAINEAGTMLFAANDAGAGSIDVFNSSFALVTNLTSGAFATPSAIASAGLVPFNVEEHQWECVCDLCAVWPRRADFPPRRARAPWWNSARVGPSRACSTAAADSKLASPWGIALAPAGFGEFGGDLLVGNFSSANLRVIDAFNPNTWAFEGSITINDGGASCRAACGRWSFGGGGNDGNANTLFFTDGLDGEKEGLSAQSPVPEP